MSQAHGADAPLPEPPADQEFLLEVEINGVSQHEPVVVRDNRARGLLLSTADLTSWGIRSPMEGLVDASGGDDFIRVTQVPGLRARIDLPRQRLIITAAPSLLPPADIALTEMLAQSPIPSIPGAFARADVLVGHDDLAGSCAGGCGTRASGLFEVGVFSGAWNADSTWLGNMTEAATATRLDTTISRDWPERMTTLRLGDAITTSGSWGRAVRIGGVHWGTDFGARPELVTFPLPAMRGEAVVPSTVDIYVNGALRAHRELPAGVFTLHDIPVVTGPGVLRLVVRDALGREQSISQPYFATNALLRAGLFERSIDVGVVREDYGLANFRYGRALASATFRRGFTDRVTGEARMELLTNQQTVGAGLSASPRSGLVVSMALAGSDGDQTGAMAQAGLDATHGSISAGLRLRTASAAFRQLGDLNDGSAAHRQLDVHVSGPAGRAANWGLVYARRQSRAEGRFDVVSATCSASLGALGFLGVFATWGPRHPELAQIAVALTRPLGSRTSSRVTASVDREQGGFGAAINRSLPAGDGSGFHLEAQNGSLERLAAGVEWQRAAGAVSVDVEKRGERSSYQAFASSGLVFMGGHLTAVRDTDSSFALVEVPAQGSVPIYRDRHLVATTDARGFAIVPGLRPYEANRLQIDSADLPLDVVMDEDEQSVRPYRRGGVSVRFPLSEQGGALIRLMQPSGAPVPTGARVSAGNQIETVALGGVVYLRGVTGETTLQVSWQGHRCMARVMVPADRILPDLGEVHCLETL